MSEIVANIVITKSDDPNEGLKVELTGEWNHREIRAVDREVVKAFRVHLMNLKRSLDEAKENENGDDEAA